MDILTFTLYAFWAIVIGGAILGMLGSLVRGCLEDHAYRRIAEAHHRLSQCMQEGPPTPSPRMLERQAANRYALRFFAVCGLLCVLLYVLDAMR